MVGSLNDLEHYLEEYLVGGWPVSTDGHRVPFSYILAKEDLGWEWEWLQYSSWQEPRNVEYTEDQPSFEMAEMLATLDAQYHKEPQSDMIRNQPGYPALRISQLERHQVLREEWLRNALDRDMIKLLDLNPPFADE